jgi:hypothetical protein
MMPRDDVMSRTATPEKAMGANMWAQPKQQSSSQRASSGEVPGRQSSLAPISCDWPTAAILNALTDNVVLTATLFIASQHCGGKTISAQTKSKKKSVSRRIQHSLTIEMCELRVVTARRW